MSSLDKIKIIMSQTDYSEEKATEKLHEWNDDYMNVIREYLNPKFQEKKPKKIKSVNQEMMSQIRNYMDNIATEYEKRKANGENSKN
tara:strand:- start:15773 stop:16033 length:261 start_codon:yes stop_codon:yes gene_type:complete